MLLIIFLSLFAKITLPAGGCDVGTQNVDNFDWTQFSGPRAWYILLHSPNDFENYLACIIVYFGSPEGNISLVTVQTSFNSAKDNFTLYANATNWDRFGFEAISLQSTPWTGRYYVKAVDYDRYVILKHCPFDSNKPNVYVGYRSQHPDNATVELVREELKKDNIDITRLVAFPLNNCK